MDATFKLFSRENFFAFAFLLILLAILWLIVTILSPFLPDFLWAFILAIAFYPLYAAMRRKLGNRANLAAFLLTTIIVIALIVPSFFVLSNLGQETKKLYGVLTSTPMEHKTQWVLEKIRLLKLQDLLAQWGMGPEDIKTIVRNNLTDILNDIPKFILDKTSWIFKNLIVLFIHILLVAVALFFFFRDGAHYADLFIRSLPLDESHQDVVSRTVSRTVSAVVRGMFVTASIQGVLAGAGFAVAGLPVPILLGLLTFINSFIPFLGATSVWLPASVWLYLENQPIAAVGLALYGAFVISMVDNIIRPLIIGGETKIPVFLLFFILLGGLKVYGFIGIFLGPILLALGMAFLPIYREIYLTPLASTARPQAEDGAETKKSASGDKFKPENS